MNVRRVFAAFVLVLFVPACTVYVPGAERAATSSSIPPPSLIDQVRAIPRRCTGELAAGVVENSSASNVTAEIRVRWFGTDNVLLNEALMIVDPIEAGAAVEWEAEPTEMSEVPRRCGAEAIQVELIP